MDNEIKIAKTLQQAFYRVWNSLGHLLVFGLFYSLATALIVKPVLRLVLKLFMGFKGYPVLINADISAFFFSLTGIFVGLLLLFGASFFVYYEFSTILHLLKTGQAKPIERKGTTFSQRRVLRKERRKEKRHRFYGSLSFSMEKALFSLSNLRNLGVFGFVLYTLLLLPILSFGLQSTLLPELSIPNFILGEVRKHTGGQALLVVLFLLGSYLFVRLFYVMPIMVFEEKGFWKAMGESWKYTKKQTIKQILLVVISLFCVTVVVAIPIVLLVIIRGVLFFPFRVAFFLFLVVGTQLIPSFILAVSLSGYEGYVPKFTVEEEDLRVQALDSKIRAFSKRISAILKDGWRKAKRWFYERAPRWLVQRPYLLLILLLIPLLIIGDIILPLTLQAEDFIVIGHRGSLDGVENTLEAIEGAVQQGADYAEIDVLLSADGVPMVIHDSNLKRLTGHSGHVGKLTAEELQGYELSDRGYVGKIPTLEEVCHFSKGKINLLIEFKTHGKEEKSLVDETVRVVRKAGVANQVKYQTLERPILLEMNLKYPEEPMGYIIYGRVGKLSTRKLLELGADFLGVEESAVSSQLVRAAHRAGLPLYVWTVNKEDSATQLYALEVDGIITDYPEDMRNAIVEENPDRRFSKVSLSLKKAFLKTLGFAAIL